MVEPCNMSKVRLCRRQISFHGYPCLDRKGRISLHQHFRKRRRMRKISSTSTPLEFQDESHAHEPSPSREQRSSFPVSLSEKHFSRRLSAIPPSHTAVACVFPPWYAESPKLHHLCLLEKPVPKIAQIISRRTPQVFMFVLC